MGKDNILLRRILILLPAVILQLAWIFLLFVWLEDYSIQIEFMLMIAAVIIVLYIVSSLDDGAYKVLWLITILTFPLLGAFLYLAYGNKKTSRKLERKITHARINYLNDLEPDMEVVNSIEDRRVRNLFEYVRKISEFPMHRNEEAIYYKIGEELFDAMVDSMKKAEKFIFVEYFIIQDGKLWSIMVDIMAEKVKEGVDVRVMYDDLGSIGTFSKDDFINLEEQGIKVISFNPMRFLSGVLNNRDHRKILVVDNEAAFSGGVNLADEYINEIERFGHWKDVGFKIKGKAVKNYTIMFCEFWNAFSNEKIPHDIFMYQRDSENGDGSLEDEEIKSDGFILPYFDSPANPDNVSYNLYIELLEDSVDYIYFYTPYLMLGDHLLNAMIRTAKRGVDVRIIMPGIPDKKMVFEMSRSYYKPLLEAGVRIFEYTPGFVHAKACVSDDLIGTVGTVNLDYRSLFLHYECNSLFYKASILEALKKDFLETQEKCVERKLNDRSKGPIKILMDSVIRVIAPLC